MTASHTDRPLADELAEWIVGFSLASSPHRDDLLWRAGLHILDGIGIALAASRMPDGVRPALRRYVTPQSFVSAFAGDFKS